MSQRFDDLHAVAYGAGLYVAAGDHGALATSPDGITWTWGNLSGDYPQIHGIIWSGSQFVAVGSGNTGFTSPDGMTWTPRSLGDSYSLAAVTWGNGQFVAVGSSSDEVSVILTSPDGMAWTPHSLGDAYSLAAVTWGNGLFVAVGSGNAVFTSPDGMTWTPRSLGDSYSLAAVTWGNGLFVAVGQGSSGTGTGSGWSSGSAVVTSPDGMTWTPRAWEGIGDYYFHGVTWDGARFAVIGARSILGPVMGPPVVQNVLLTSLDGAIWAEQYPSGDLDSIYYSSEAVTWGNGLFVAVGSGNAVLTSPDGITWTPRTMSMDGGFSDVTWGNGQFVAVGHDTVFTSPDGITWTDPLMGDPSSRGLCAVTWGNGQFVAVGDIMTSRYLALFQLLTSPDGMTWASSLVESHSYGNYGHIGCTVIWGDGQFVAVGISYQVLTSPDGIAWTPYPTNMQPYILDMAWGNGRFVAVGSGNAVFTSPDGVTWTPHALDKSYTLYAVTWGNGQFVAVGRVDNQDVSVILTSLDGMTWTSHALNDNYRLHLSEVTWGNGQFVAVGAQYDNDSYDSSSIGMVLTSPDGMTWTPHPVDTGYGGLEGIAWNGSQFVAVGDGIILRSDCSGSDDAATTLITHYYTSILGRAPEEDGLAYWQGLIAERQAQGIDVKPVFRDMARFFFNSPEYLGNNASDTQFVTDLYRTFFQREPDRGGMSFWLDQLATGWSRDEVMNGFLYSPEFTSFMQGLGF